MTARDRYLRKTYGVTEEEYAQVLAAQGGKCWICGRKPTGRRLHVDHNHKQKGRSSVRGVICYACNSGLRWFRDKPASLRAAADYLEALPFAQIVDLTVPPSES